MWLASGGGAPVDANTAILQGCIQPVFTKDLLARVKGVACETINIAHWLVGQARPTTADVHLVQRLMAYFLIHEPYQKTYFLSHQGTQIVT